MRRITTAVAVLLLSGCVAAPPAAGPRPVAPRPVRPTHLSIAGLERVIGKDARTLAAYFGVPDQDLHEGKARRLQFVGPACVLDVYLYPPAPGREPLVTYVDARQPNGEDFDRASCVAALSRRR